MGFKSLIEGQVQSAMRILGTDEDGLARKQTYVSIGEGTYNWETRSRTGGETPHEGIPMTLTRFRIDDMDDQVRPQTDRRALIASLDLPVTPETDDYVLIDGMRYNVQRLLSDPADAMYIVHIRRQ